MEAPLIAKSFFQSRSFCNCTCGKKGGTCPFSHHRCNRSPKRVPLRWLSSAWVNRLKRFAGWKYGDYITDMVGPLGKATHIENFGTVVCAGKIGVAPMLPIIEAMKNAGNKVITVLAARTKELIILEEQVRKYSDRGYHHDRRRFIRRKGIGYQRGGKNNTKGKSRPLRYHWPRHHDEVCGTTDKKIRGAHLPHSIPSWWTAPACVVPAVLP